MARRAATTTVDPDELEIERPAQQLPRTFEHDEIDADPEADDFDAILASVGDDATQLTVRLYRELKGGKSEYLSKYTPKEWLATDLDGVQSTFGPGDYRIRIYDQRSKVRKHKTFSIGAPTIDTLAARVSAPPAIDPVQLANQITQSLAGALAPLLQMVQQQQRGPSREDMLRELVVMKQIFAGNDSPRVDPLDLIQKVMSITRDVSPREGETGPYDVFLELTKAFAPVLMQGATRSATAPESPAPSAPPRPIAPAAPGAPAGAPGMKQSPQPEPEADDMKMKIAIAYLCEQAKRESDPALYAELVIDNMGDEAAASVLAMPEDQLLQTLAAHDSRVTLYSQWFRDLRVAMREILTDDAGEDTTSQNGAQDVNGATPPDNATTH